MPQSPLELRHLQTLVALADTGSLAKAAERVFVTQSALSHQIKALESHYGAPLFERNTKPLRFTQAGARLLAAARDVLTLTREAERDVAQWVSGCGGQLRIAVECHTCFDWLMPAMDAFRVRWPEVELDIVSGFQADPVGLLHQDRAELAIVSEVDAAEAGVVFHPLFSFEIVALLPTGHALLDRPWLEAADFAPHTLITYPVPDEMLDLVRRVLQPAGVAPPRRTSELTVAMLQLVASGRGLAALPLWAVKSYLDRGYVAHQRIGPRGLTGRLHAASSQRLADRPYLAEFVKIMRETSLRTLPGVTLLQPGPVASSATDEARAAP